MKISAIILARNEEKKIEKAASSLSFCDEVIVVDDDSSDKTVKIAEEVGARVLSHTKHDGFAEQRNWAMEQAKNEWVLFIDADEEITEELKNEIIALSTSHSFSAYSIPRRDFFWNTELKYGETGRVRKDGIVRLMKKGSGVWTGAVHETFIPSGSVGKLHGFLNHYSHESVSTFVQDINVYSTLRAEELAKERRKVSTWELITFPFGKFMYTYFMLGGFLDGPAGFVYSFIMSFHSFLVRSKLIVKSYV